MAYQIKKNDKIIEDLELLASDNSVAMTLHIDINTSSIATKFRRVQLELIHAQKAVQEHSEEALQTFEKAAASMFGLIFGEENTAKMLEYFEGNYSELSIQIMPFIYDVIQPAIAEYATNRKEIIANNYGLNRKQKRKLGL